MHVALILAESARVYANSRFDLAQAGCGSCFEGKPLHALVWGVRSPADDGAHDLHLSVLDAASSRHVIHEPIQFTVNVGHGPIIATMPLNLPHGRYLVQVSDAAAVLWRQPLEILASPFRPSATFGRRAPT
jgi:hypothetical protein